VAVYMALSASCGDRQIPVDLT